MTTTYAFYSVKGGAGKTTLAVAAGVAFARAGRAVAVVDADLTGTSLADGLALRAPRPAVGADRQWAGPTDGYLTREETLAQRRTLSLGGPASCWRGDER